MMAFLATLDKLGHGGNLVLMAATGHREIQAQQDYQDIMAGLVSLDKKAGREKRETL